MNEDLERVIRNEALALKEAGVASWSRRLLANGLDPDRWSHEVEALRTLPPREVALRVPGADPSRWEAARSDVRRHPELFFSTRTSHKGDIQGLRSSDLSSFDSKTNTVECVWTTGAPVLRFDGCGFYYEVLDVNSKAVRLDRLNAGASFLDTHRSDDLSAVLGAVVRGSAKVTRGIGLCRILLSSASGCADAIENIKAGVVRNCSVGYLVHATIWSDDDKGGLPTCRVTDWEPFEISAVPVPADPGAQLRALWSAQPSQDQALNVIRARVRARLRMLMLPPSPP